VNRGTATVERAASPRSRRRPEIEGLRGLAAVLVVVYHVWVGRVSGGVDVFFVLSGFLIVGLLARTVERGDRLDLGRTWTRLFWRLVPTAALVLLVSSVAAAVVLPASRWAQNQREAVSSTLFVENWRLALDAVDYYAENSAASVVQHFWSLSIQGQFYVVAPVLVLFVAGLCRANGIDVRRGLLVTLSAGGSASFVYSVVATASDQPFAYFDSRARAWEFAVGGVLALVIERLRPARGVRAALGWTGLVALVACGAVLDVGAAFPGALALWPVAAAVAIVVAGQAGGADRLLSSPPAQYLGAISYPLYLWHWPVLVLYLVHTGNPTPGTRGGVTIVAASLVLAVVTHHLVEEPARRLSLDRLTGPRRGVLVALPLVPVLLVAGVWSAVATSTTGPPVVDGDPDHPGSQALRPDIVPAWADAPLRPSLIEVGEDWADIRRGCAPVIDHPVLEQCVPVPAVGAPERRVVVVGDSHMQQLVPALEPLARERGWELRTLVRGGCPFSTGSEAFPDDASCVDWNTAAIEYLSAEQPDAVVVGATRDVRQGLLEQTPPGFVAAWQRLDAAGVPVVAVRDNPRFDHRPSECLEANGRGASVCDVPRSELLSPQPPYLGVEGMPDNVSFLDLSDDICTATTCPPEVGNVLVYLDDNHLSASYSRTMSGTVSRELPALLGW